MGETIKLTLSSIVLLVALAAAFRRPSTLFYWLVATIPWFGLQIAGDLTASVDRLLAACLLVASLGASRQTLPRPVMAFAVYAFIATALMSLYLPPVAADAPPFRGQWRWLGQMALWSLYLAPIAYASRHPLDINARTAYRVLLASVSALGLLGIAQFAVYLFTGYDMFPLAVIDGVRYMGAFESEAFGTVFRASSLGGEPKHLAYSLVIGLTVLAADYVSGTPLALSGGTRIGLALVLGGSLLLTFSTQGFLLFGINLFLIALLYKRHGNASGHRRGVPLAVGLTALFLLYYVRPDIFSLLTLRTSERISDAGYLEDWNEVILAWLMDHPSYTLLGVGLGNVHFYANNYMPVEYDYGYNNIFVAKSGFLRIVSELGIVGLGFLIWAYIAPLYRMAKRPPLPVFRFQQIVALAVGLNFLVSLDGPAYLFPVAALSIALARLPEPEIPTGPRLTEKSAR